MNEAIRLLEPKPIWNNFTDLNAVPRPSKKEERVIGFMTEFGRDLGLVTEVDEIGNVLIKKPATPGMEDRKTVVLQSHLDMVHQKNNDTTFDFDSQGIKMWIDGDWVRADGTTLGADNGLGVAAIMALLQSETLEHPALEALFTIDEETGMTGAKELRENWLKGEILLNLDTEEDDEIGVGCAGGVDVTAKGTYSEVEATAPVTAIKIVVKGLKGGHSGMDIDKGLGNANKLMNRLLFEARDRIRLQSVHGGSLRNAIPRESQAVVLAETGSEDVCYDLFNEVASRLKEEYKSLEPELQIVWDAVDTTSGMHMPAADQHRFLKAMQAAHNGVYRMSPDIKNLVETSNNIAKVTVEKGKISIDSLSRSSVESTKWDLVDTLEAVFELAGLEVQTSGDYPGWAPNMESGILKVMESLYKEMFDESPHVAACHAGLECGILGEHYPDIDMISFGPNILGAHSPDERASISSTQKFWSYLTEILKRIPKK